MTRPNPRSCTPEGKIAGLREIVREKQHAKVCGQRVDLFTALVVTQVYDALNDANKTKFSAMPLSKMAQIAFKLAR